VQPTRTLALIATILAGLSLADSAAALDKCKAKTDPKDGTIVVSAAGVSGTLKWGGSVAGATNAFFNPGCVAAGVAKGCVLGDVGTEARITPPRQCRIHLADDTATCSVFLKHCTPTAQGFITAASSDSFICPASSICSHQTPASCPGNSLPASMVRCTPQPQAGVDEISSDPIFEPTIACDVTVENTNGSPVEVFVDVEALCIPAAE
jgi:hypothetical protein